MLYTSSSNRYPTVPASIQSYNVATPSYASTYYSRPAETTVQVVPSSYAVARSEPLPSRVAVGDAGISYGDAGVVNVNRSSTGAGSPSRIVKGAGYVADARGPAPASYYTTGGYGAGYGGAVYTGGSYAGGGSVYGGSGYGGSVYTGGVYGGSGYAGSVYGGSGYAGSRISYERPGGSYRVLAGPADGPGSYPSPAYF